MAAVLSDMGASAAIAETSRLLLQAHEIGAESQSIAIEQTELLRDFMRINCATREVIERCRNRYSLPIVMPPAQLECDKSVVSICWARHENLAGDQWVFPGPVEVSRDSRYSA